VYTRLSGELRDGLPVYLFPSNDGGDKYLFHARSYGTGTGAAGGGIGLWVVAEQLGKPPYVLAARDTLDAAAADSTAERDARRAGREWQWRGKGRGVALLPDQLTQVGGGEADSRARLLIK
jgi:hypothetical protein